MKAHYIYTKYGAFLAMGLRDESRLDYHIKKVKKMGLKVSKIIHGIEYFDIDILTNPKNYIFKKDKTKVIKKQLSFNF